MSERNPDSGQAVTSETDAMRKALGSCVWVLNNKHNADDPRWHLLADAALKDARDALDTCGEAWELRMIANGNGDDI